MKLADEDGPGLDTADSCIGARLEAVAFDISLDASPQPVEPAPADFEEFYTAKVDVVVAALTLSCADSEVTDAAVTAALTKSSQRWNHLVNHPNPAGWVVQAGLAHAEKALRDHAPAGINRATGGYERGLSLDLAFATLPLLQRAALITGYYLEWSDAFTAAGFETPLSTVRTRRERAISFIGHHLRLDEAEVIPLVRSHLQELSERDQPAPPAMAVVRRSGRRRTVANRIAAGLAVATLIVTGGALFQAGDRVQVAATPEVVEGPSTSAKWFGPVSDGQGAFVALNTSGASRFVGSKDGTEWIKLTTWNSRAIDLRADVSSFERTGGRYVTVIETPSRYDAFVPPFVATSDDLRNWNVRQIDVGEPRRVEGLRSRFDVVANAASGGHVLVALEGSDQLDYRSFDLRADQVCVESDTPLRREYFLCDGKTIVIATPDGDELAGTTYFRSTGTGPFVEIQLPVDAVARSIVGFAGGFAVVDSNLGHVWVSTDGEAWQRATSSATANRFVLIEGGDSEGSGALVIEPDATGWRSQVVSPSGLGAAGSIPLKVEPAGVWSQPDLASGPAGWALFVTTSRPWERTGSIPGWAVVAGEWIVSQLPETATITAQSTESSTTLRFVTDSEWAQVDDDGTIVLVDPRTGSVLVEVTQEDIDQARPESLGTSRVKAQVLFSPDGVSWRSVWTSTEDAWSGSVAVGDSEVLVSGTQLTGGPITIQLDG